MRIDPESIEETAKFVEVACARVVFPVTLSVPATATLPAESIVVVAVWPKYPAFAENSVDDANPLNCCSPVHRLLLPRFNAATTAPVVGVIVNVPSALDTEVTPAAPPELPAVSIASASIELPLTVCPTVMPRAHNTYVCKLVPGSRSTALNENAFSVLPLARVIATVVLLRTVPAQLVFLIAIFADPSVLLALSIVPETVTYSSAVVVSGVAVTVARVVVETVLSVVGVSSSALRSTRFEPDGP